MGRLWRLNWSSSSLVIIIMIHHYYIYGHQWKFSSEFIFKIMKFQFQPDDHSLRFYSLLLYFIYCEWNSISYKEKFRWVRNLGYFVDVSENLFEIETSWDIVEHFKFFEFYKRIIMFLGLNNIVFNKKSQWPQLMIEMRENRNSWKISTFG